MNSFPTHTQLASCLQTEYGIQVVTIYDLPHGADMNAKVYKVCAKEQDQYFVKVKSGHLSTVGIQVACLLSDAGIKEVIVPIKTHRGDEWLLVDGCMVIVYPFIQGQNGFVTPLTNDQWVKLGKTLRLLHKMPVPASLQSKIDREVYSKRWQAAVRRILHAPGSNEITDILLEKKPEIEELIRHVEVLGSELKSMTLEYVLCHSDIHAGNVLLADDQALFIVDWDAPIRAPKERDLMFIGGGVANCWNKSNEEALFYQGYGKTDINKTALRYFRAARILEDIVEYYEAFSKGVNSDSERKTMYEQFSGMFYANGVVDIALRS